MTSVFHAPNQFKDYEAMDMMSPFVHHQSPNVEEMNHTAASMTLLDPSTEDGFSTTVTPAQDWFDDYSYNKEETNVIKEDEEFSMIATPTQDFSEEYCCNGEETNEDFSTIVTPTQDWSEEYPNDEDDETNDEKVNGTGLVLYVTPTATKTSYWKRRLGFKPHMTKKLTRKMKQVFRNPVRNSVRTGRSYEIHGADALVANHKQQVGKNDRDQKWACDDEEDRVLGYGTTKDSKSHFVHCDLVFA